MNKDLIKISWIEDGVKHPWITVFDCSGLYENHPERKYAYQEQDPSWHWFDCRDGTTLQDVMAYLWKNVISVSAIIEKNLTIVIERGE